MQKKFHSCISSIFLMSFFITSCSHVAENPSIKDRKIASSKESDTDSKSIDNAKSVYPQNCQINSDGKSERCDVFEWNEYTILKANELDCGITPIRSGNYGYVGACTGIMKIQDSSGKEKTVEYSTSFRNYKECGLLCYATLTLASRAEDLHLKQKGKNENKKSADYYSSLIAKHSKQ